MIEIKRRRENGEQSLFSFLFSPFYL